MFTAALFIIAKKMETIQMSTDWWTAEQYAAYLYNGTLFGHKKKWSTDTCYDMDKPWKHYTEWKKPVTKDYILYDSIYRKSAE